MEEEKDLEKAYSSQARKLMEGKLAEVFKDDLKTLSSDFQVTLVDDLVTAFQNRLSVFAKIQSKHES